MALSDKSVSRVASGMCSPAATLAARLYRMVQRALRCAVRISARAAHRRGARARWRGNARRDAALRCRRRDGGGAHRTGGGSRRGGGDDVVVRRRSGVCARGVRLHALGRTRRPAPWGCLLLAVLGRRRLGGHRLVCLRHALPRLHPQRRHELFDGRRRRGRRGLRPGGRLGRRRGPGALLLLLQRRELELLAERDGLLGGRGLPRRLVRVLREAEVEPMQLLRAVHRRVRRAVAPGDDLVHQRLRLRVVPDVAPEVDDVVVRLLLGEQGVRERVVVTVDEVARDEEPLLRARRREGRGLVRRHAVDAGDGGDAVLRVDVVVVIEDHGLVARRDLGPQLHLRVHVGEVPPVHARPQRGSVLRVDHCEVGDGRLARVLLANEFHHALAVAVAGHQGGAVRVEHVVLRPRVLLPHVALARADVARVVAQVVRRVEARHEARVEEDAGEGAVAEAVGELVHLHPVVVVKFEQVAHAVPAVDEVGRRPVVVLLEEGGKKPPIDRLEAPPQRAGARDAVLDRGDEGVLARHGEHREVGDAARRLDVLPLPERPLRRVLLPERGAHHQDPVALAEHARRARAARARRRRRRRGGGRRGGCGRRRRLPGALCSRPRTSRAALAAAGGAAGRWRVTAGARSRNLAHVRRRVRAARRKPLQRAAHAS
mmetsp:Transcript_25798/g.79578  ORF Transcript_25798/g.79578 Transcript_25798/m.79578 type:complete len:658 (-) Transcript_25798:106-2079(-)